MTTATTTRAKQFFTVRAGRRLSRLVRAELGLEGSPYRIEFTPGFDGPQLRGYRYYHTNKSGDVIRHPNAYARAWGKPVYHASTLHIVVGAGWCLERLLSAA